MTTINGIPVIDTDVLVIGGGTAGPMAAVTVKEQDPNLKVILLEKANVKRSGAISMGMDGLNNAVVPGHATPEQYVKEHHRQRRHRSPAGTDGLCPALLPDDREARLLGRAFPER